MVSKTSQKYVDLWKRNSKSILSALQSSEAPQSVQLNSLDFHNVGNRLKAGYSFNLEFKKGVVNNDIGGSAVARDLARVLTSSSEIFNILKVGHYKINMDKEFCLWMKRM